MTFFKIIGWLCLVSGGVMFFWTPRLAVVAVVGSTGAAFILCGLYAYEIGRDSAFADVRKFGRAFARAKEP